MPPKKPVGARKAKSPSKSPKSPGVSPGKRVPDSLIFAAFAHLEPLNLDLCGSSQGVHPDDALDYVKKHFKFDLPHEFEKRFETRLNRLVGEGALVKRMAGDHFRYALAGEGDSVLVPFSPTLGSPMDGSPLVALEEPPHKRGRHLADDDDDD